ncbi:MAG: RluA family pseudouridine synthase [Bauldia sp.]
MPGVESKTVDADADGMRLDRWFREHYPDVAFGHLQKLLRSGQIRVDGARAKTNTRLASGQAVRIPPLGKAASENLTPSSSERPARLSPQGAPRKAPKTADGEALAAMVLYEDDSLAVLNKPFGLAVQGGSGLTRHLDGMLEAWRDAKGQKPRLVHRLDRDTTGVIVVAKTRLAASRLAASFRNRSSRKIYWALVAGVPRPSQGRISTWLAKEGGEGGEKMRVAAHGERDADHAVSLYSVVDHAGPVAAWLTMRPVTGRTHQLRAHAAHIGHPIVGDPKYFNRENWELPGGIQKRLHLHARRIVMEHPDGGTLDVTAPLPDHMTQSWNLLGFDVSRVDPTELEPA